MDQITRDELMRFLDGESSPEEQQRIKAQLDRSTELNRELAIFRAMKQDLQGLSFSPSIARQSTWEVVNLRLSRPLGWIFMVLGTVVWIAYGSYVYVNSAIDVWEKIATGAIAIGIVILFATVIYERYKAWLTDPYKDVHR